MAYFCSDEATFHESTVRATYQQYLKDQLTLDPWKTALRPWGGADVFTLEQAPETNRSARKPFLVIMRSMRELDSMRHWGRKIGDTVYSGQRHKWKLSIDAVATEASGTLKNATNLRSSDIILCDFMHWVHNEQAGYEALTALKLEGPLCEVDKEAARDIQRSNPHLVTFMTTTIPGAPS